MTHDAPAVRLVATHAYSVFSHAFWPAYVPFAVLMLERTQWRRRVLAGFQLAGVVVSAYMLWFIMSPPLVAQVDVHPASAHLLYLSPNHYGMPMSLLYVIVTCGSCLVSGSRFVRLFGVLAAVSFAIAYTFHTRALISVWCFFAAVLSMTILLPLRDRARARSAILGGSHGIV